ncbi:unnamed protein product [Cochlearia groenlandica]
MTILPYVTRFIFFFFFLSSSQSRRHYLDRAVTIPISIAPSLSRSSVLSFVFGVIAENKKVSLHSIRSGIDDVALILITASHDLLMEKPIV